MSEKDKNGNYQLYDFLRYRGNIMTDKERNVFEKNLQKDPFAEEASEGLEGIDTPLAEKDILSLRKQIKKRTTGRKRIFWYRIAASVAVIMILSSILIIIEKRKLPEEIAYVPATRPFKDNPTVKDVKIEEKLKKETGPSEKILPTTAIKRKNAEAPVETPKTEIKPYKKFESKEQAISIEKQRSIPATELKESDKAVSGEKSMPEEPVPAKMTSGTSSKIKGRIISSEDNQPIPGVNITVKGTNKGTLTDPEGNFSLGREEARNRVLVAEFVGMVSKEFKAMEDTCVEIRLEPSPAALSEIVVVGYGSKGTGDVREDAQAEYIPPQPVNGEADFNKYILKNLRRPDSATTGQRVVVVLNFKVDANGKIDSIKIIRSPGKIFSDEAIRLIREGPAWKPAEENGKRVDEEVRIRIVFN